MRGKGTWNGSAVGFGWSLLHLPLEMFLSGLYHERGQSNQRLASLQGGGTCHQGPKLADF